MVDKHGSFRPGPAGVHGVHCVQRGEVNRDPLTLHPIEVTQAGDGDHPIVPIMIGDEKAAVTVARRL